MLLVQTVIHCVLAVAVLVQLHVYADEAVKTGNGDKRSHSSRPQSQQASTGSSRQIFLTPKLPDGAYFVQYFPGPGTLADHHLVVSQSKKDGEPDTGLAKYDGLWSVEVPSTSAIEGDFALVMKSPARHYAISSRLAKPFVFAQPDKQFVLQYEVKFQQGMECGGAYLKLITDQPDLNLQNFTDKTPYTIMFGPDKCGPEHKLHFILRHRNSATGIAEEKHAKKPKVDLDAYFSDKRTHLYTLVINSDNRFEVYVDRVLVNSGSLLEDLVPPINPLASVDDPTDAKPADWDDREMIPDPSAARPADWDETQPELVEDELAVMPTGWLLDEPRTVPDPRAEKPRDWDDDMDGVWEPARVDNPKCADAPGCGPWTRPKLKNSLYRGIWSPPMMKNPAYKGVWQPRQIPNPNLHEDKEPWRFAPIGAIGLELWTVTEGAAFDNLLIVDRKQLADAFAEQTWAVKRLAERQTDWAFQSVIDTLRDATRERPWIWAALLVVVVLPLVLLITYCCCLREGSSSAAAAAARARHKKTDGDGGDGQPKSSLESDDEAEPDDNDDDDDLVNVREAPAGAEADPESEDSDEPPELVDLDAPDDDDELDVVASDTGARKRPVRKE